MNDTDRLEKVLAFALLAHQGQVYEGLGAREDEPYILHPIRVALSVHPSARVVAILHDVFEDTEATINDVPDGLLRADEAFALGVLTRDKKGESYAEYIARIVQSGSPLALIVKHADLLDNVGNLPPNEVSPRSIRYTKALQSIGLAMEHAMGGPIKAW